MSAHIYQDKLRSLLNVTSSLRVGGDSDIHSPHAKHHAKLMKIDGKKITDEDKKTIDDIQWLYNIGGSRD